MQAFESRLSVRKLLFETYLPDTPYTHFGSCFVARLQGHLFVLTAYHLIGLEGRIDWDNVLVMIDPKASRDTFGFDIKGTNRLKLILRSIDGELESDEFDDVLDFAWARVRMSQLDSELLSNINLFDLDSCLMSEEFPEGLQLTILGHAEDSQKGQHIDYDQEKINLWLHSATGHISTSRQISKCKSIAISECSSDSYQGFSGSPVFVGIEPNHRLAGLAVMGDVHVETIHFIPAYLIRQTLMPVVEKYPLEQNPEDVETTSIDIELFD